MTTIINGSSPSITFSDGSAQTSATRPFQNRLINGGMTISQRNGTSAVTIDGGASYTLDRYLCQDNTDGSFSVQQSSTAPTGFNNSMLVTITGTDSSLTTTQFGRIVQRIEGFNTADLGWGTASASTVTLSFWVRSSVTGTFSGTLVNNDSNRIYAFTYTINAANTFEYKTITIAGDTTGTWATNNSTGIELNLSIGAGPDRSVAAGSWGTSLAYAATGQTNLFATSSATFYITGVQLEVGSTATSFDYRPYTTELSLCQRYFVKDLQNASSATFLIGVVDASTSADRCGMRFPVTMRTSPTAAVGGTTNPRIYDGSAPAVTSIISNSSSSFGASLSLGASAGGLTVGRAAIIIDNNASFITYSAEL